MILLKLIWATCLILVMSITFVLGFTWSVLASGFNCGCNTWDNFDIKEWLN